MIQSFRANPSFAYVLKNLGRLHLAGHERHIRSIRLECLFERLLIALSLSGHDDERLRSNPHPAQIQIRLHSIRIRITLPVSLRSGD